MKVKVDMKKVKETIILKQCFGIKHIEEQRNASHWALTRNCWERTIVNCRLGSHLNVQYNKI